jgi:hypothetical protein
MKLLPLCLGVLSAVVLAFSYCSLLVADQVRYMDSSGNIHFVDRPSEVPKKYILQVMTATPTPYLDRRALNELKRKKMQAQADQMRQQRQRENEARRHRDQQEREARKEERELQRRDASDRVSRGS